MFYRLVSRAVLSVAHGVVSEDEEGGQLHQRREPNRRPCVIAKDKESRAKGSELRKREPVDNRPHSMLADAEMQVLSSGVICLEISCPFVLEDGLVRRSKIRRAA